MQREAKDASQAKITGQSWPASRLRQCHRLTYLLSLSDSSATIIRRVALGVGFCLAIFLLAIWGVKLQRR